MSIDHHVHGGLETDLGDLRAALARHPFPATQDDVLALLVARHQPSRLLWRAASLDRTRRYHSLDEVCDEIARSSSLRMPPPPGR